MYSRRLSCRYGGVLVGRGTLCCHCRVVVRVAVFDVVGRCLGGSRNSASVETDPVASDIVANEPVFELFALVTGLPVTGEPLEVVLFEEPPADRDHLRRGVSRRECEIVSRRLHHPDPEEATEPDRQLLEVRVPVQPPDVPHTLPPEQTRVLSCLHLLFAGPHGVHPPVVCPEPSDPSWRVFTGVVVLPNHPDAVPLDELQRRSTRQVLDDGETATTSTHSCKKVLSVPV